jgi:hypothetical protein
MNHVPVLSRLDQAVNSVVFRAPGWDEQTDIRTGFLH